MATFRDPTGRELSDLKTFRAQPGQPENTHTAVILAFGASNIANEGDPAGRFTPSEAVHNFNFLDGNAYVAKDPLLGATRDRSNVLTRLADQLVRDNIFRSILLVPIAHGSTFAADWAPGGSMHPRLTTTLDHLRRNSIAVTHMLFQQGEAEAHTQRNSEDGHAWQNSFHAVADSLRHLSLSAPIYVAQSTVCRNKPNAVIRDAQRAVVDPLRKIFAGPDTDTIGLDERWDGCHFSTSGLSKAATLWFKAINRA